MMVISRWATVRSVNSSPTSMGRFSAARSGSTSAPGAALMSATVVMNSPCTNRSLRVTITTTECFGEVWAIDCGISMPLVFWMISTSVEYTSRNATITDRMSISGMRFRVASARLRTWCCAMRNARLEMLMVWIPCHLAARRPGRLPAPLARQGQRTLLFDGALGLANVDVQLGITPRRDLGGVIAGQLTLPEAASRFADGGFDILAGRSGSGSLGTLPLARLAGLRNELH